MALFPQTKSNKIFWGVGLFFVAFFLFIAGYYYYDQWHGQKRVEELKQALENFEKEVLARKSADKIGGKTPLETLDMYIKAVEAEDYELASKYLIIEKQQEELKILQTSKKENIENIIKLLKQAKNSQGEYSFDKKGFSFYKPISVDFILYPSGNWKIEEI